MDLKNRIRGLVKECQKNWFLYMAGLTGAGLIVAVSLIYRGHFPFDFSPSQEVWGQFGDYFGGVLNPILSFAAFIGLLVTIGIQRSESRSADARHSSQLFEDRVFQLVSISHTTVSSLRFHHPTPHREVVYEGHRGVIHAWIMLDTRLGAVRERSNNPGSFEFVRTAYEKWKKDYWSGVAGYYDTVIFTAEYILKSKFDSELIAFHLRFLRSQMTPEERTLLLYILLFDGEPELLLKLSNYQFFSPKIDQQLYHSIDRLIISARNLL